MPQVEATSQILSTDIKTILSKVKLSDLKSILKKQSREFNSSIDS